MLIGELSKRTGLSRDTIRFYEKEGLIRVPKKQRRENNYKEYSESIIDRLIMIRSVQELDFTIREINMFFKLWQEEEASCKTLVYTLENKLIKIEEQIEKLNQLKGRLIGSLQKCHNDECEFERSVPDCLKNC